MVQLMITCITLVLFPCVAVISHRTLKDTTDCQDITEHFQNKYCKAEFVIKVTIKRSRPEGYGQLLDVRLKTQFKINEVFTSLADDILNQIRLNASQDIKEGFKYLLSGRIVQDGNAVYLMTEGCDWVQEWAAVPQRQKAFLHKGLLDQNCDCRVESPSEAELSGPNRLGAFPDSMCILPDTATSRLPTPKQALNLITGKNKNNLTITKFSHNWRLKSDSAHECFHTYAFCQKRARSDIGTRCEWSKNDQLKDCLIANGVADTDKVS